MVVKNQYGMCVVELPVCIHIYKLTSVIRIIYCVLLVIVHVDGKYFFAELQICHTLVLRHSQRSLCCSFPTTNERCKGLNSAPPTYLCSKSAGSQRNRKTQWRRWHDGQDAVAFFDACFDALVAVAAFFISSSLHKIVCVWGWMYMYESECECVGEGYVSWLHG